MISVTNDRPAKSSLGMFPSHTRDDKASNLGNWRAHVSHGSPGSTSGKECTCQCGRHRDAGSIPGLGRSPGEEDGNPPQYSCLENSTGQRSLLGYSPWGRKKLDMTEVTKDTCKALQSWLTETNWKNLKEKGGSGVCYTNDMALTEFLKTLGLRKELEAWTRKL